MFRDFTDLEIMEKFQESLVTLFKNQEGEADHYFGMYVGKLPKACLTRLGISLRELIHEFKWQTLVLFKCCLLQPKVGFLLLWFLLSGEGS